MSPGAQAKSHAPADGTEGYAANLKVARLRLLIRLACSQVTLPQLVYRCGRQPGLVQMQQRVAALPHTLVPALGRRLLSRSRAVLRLKPSCTNPALDIIDSSAWA